MEEIAKLVTRCIGHLAELVSAFIIGIAVIRITWKYLASQWSAFPSGREKHSYDKLQPGGFGIEFGTSVAVALELLLGADVLATAVAPSWSDIGQLAAIAIIRTALNHFLRKELEASRVLKHDS